ncbi:MAG: PKD domain-containing protein [Caldilinea sp. CFX5]|nr:PKD domain-containing protein [Caldilinea sp. CFX5]
MFLRPRLLHFITLPVVFALTLLFLGSAQAKPAATEIKGGNMYGETVWIPAGNPYILSGDINLWGSLTIEPDVVVQVQPGSRLNVYGTLTISGTVEHPVYFTSIKDDDTPLGDVNGDGNATVPQPGDWQCICINGVGNFRYAIIRYAGEEIADNAPGWDEGTHSYKRNANPYYPTLYAAGGTTLTLDYVTLQAASVGIHAVGLGGPNVMISNSQIISMSQAAIMTGMWKGAEDSYSDQRITMTNSVLRANGSGLLLEKAIISSTSSTIINNEYGIQLKETTGTLTRNLISNNRVGVVAESIAQLDHNSILGNQDFGIIADFLSTDLDARNTWWGHASGPQHINNPSGQGDRVSDHVTYVPWLTSLSDPGGTGVIEGQVVTRKGVPLAEVTISLSNAQTTTTLLNGTFRFDGLLLGDYQMSAQKDGFMFALKDDSGTEAFSPDFRSLNNISLTLSDSISPILAAIIAVPEPVIFVPGVAGSELFEVSQGIHEHFEFGKIKLDPPVQVWPRILLSQYALLDQEEVVQALSLAPCLGDDVCPNYIVTATDSIRQVATMDFYAPLIQAFRRAGFTEYTVNLPADRTSDHCDTTQQSSVPSLFIFAYDWRKSNVESAQALKEYVDCIRQIYNINGMQRIGQVNIVAHSMGGLVTRRYILDNPEQHHVKRVITIGTPWWGAPKLLHVLDQGSFFDELFKPTFIDFGSPSRRWFILSRDNQKKLLQYFPGAHELLPSEPYFQTRSPINPVLTVWREYQSEYGANTAVKTYSYDEMVSWVNQNYAPHKLENCPDNSSEPIVYCPGTNSRRFHADQPGQDIWDATTTGDVEYHHFVGRQGIAMAMGGVEFAIIPTCAKSDPSTGPGSQLSACSTEQIVKPLPTIGDGTVPIESAMRTSATRYPPGENIYLYKVISPVDASFDAKSHEQADHIGMTKYSDVQDCVLSILSTGSCQTGANSSLKIITPFTHQSDYGVKPAAKSLIQNEVTTDAYYVTVVGTQQGLISDFADNVTGILSDTYMANEVAGVSYFPMNEHSFLAILPVNNPYTLTVKSMDRPVLIEIRKGTHENTTNAIRYRDVTLPVNTIVQLRFTDSNVESLEFDSDGDEKLDSLIVPTHVVSGVLAEDISPPAIRVTESVNGVDLYIEIQASDDKAGLDKIYYSLDGTYFQVYTQAVRFAGANQALYAFADDRVGNRSSLTVYRVELNPVNINKISLVAPSVAYIGLPYTLTASVQPLTATAPFTYIWQVGGHALVTRVSGRSDSLNVSWSVPSVQLVSVTVQNAVSQQIITTQIIVQDVPIDQTHAMNSSPTPLGNATAFTATVNAGTNVTYEWNFGDGSTGVGAHQLHTYVAPGIYTATLTATNSSGNASTSTTVQIVSPFDLPPDTHIDSHPNNPTDNTTANFIFSGTDDITPSNLLTFACALDGAAFVRCNNPQLYSGLGIGSHTFLVRAVDAAGNIDPTPASYTWQVNDKGSNNQLYLPYVSQ